MAKRTNAITVLIVALLLVLGCSSGDDSPPGKILDLAFKVETRQIFWTAPGDDDQSGQATIYDLRFFEDSEIAAFLGLPSLAGVPDSTISKALADNFDIATQIQAEPTPEPGGTPQDFVIDRLDLLGTKKFYFALNARDEVGNNSGPSNVVEVESSLSSVEFESSDPVSCFGASVASGDFNDDRINDILIGDPCKGIVFLFLGRNDLANPELTGVDGKFNVDTGDVPDTLIIGSVAEEFGASVSSIASFEGDRSLEFAIGAPMFGGGKGRFYIFEGQEDGLPPVIDLNTIDLSSGDGAPIVIVDGENAGDLFGSTMADAFGVEGGFRRDLLVGAPGFGSSTGRLYLFRVDTLDTNALATDAKAMVDGEAAGDMFGFALDVVGKIDENNSLSDIGVGAPGAGKVYVLFGKSDFDSIDLSTDLSLVTVLSGSAADGFGSSLAGGGDLDGFIDPENPIEGPGDLLVGIPGDSMSTGKVLLFSGNDIEAAIGTGANPPVSSEITGVSPGDRFGASVAVLGDMNPGIDRIVRDEGIILGQIITNADFVIGAPGTTNGTLYFFFGSDTLPSMMTAGDATITINGSSAGLGLGEMLTPLGDVTGDSQNDFAASGDRTLDVEF